MAKRRITASRRSKHIGHACEGHLRGILLHLPGFAPHQLVRSLPFHTPVKSDAILLDKKGLLQAIFVVAFWDHAGSSEKKLYRTRTEIREIERARSIHKSVFADGFRAITILYGSATGWKRQVLDDIRSDCAPAMFLPEVIGPRPTSGIVDRVFREYATHWENGRSNAREHVEQLVSQRTLSKAEAKILWSISDCLSRPAASLGPSARPAITGTVRLPASDIRTRYRQALGMLSLFTEEEVMAWQAGQAISHSPNAERFARRAYFLGMGELCVRKSIRGTAVAQFQLLQPFGDDGAYAPDKPDFVSWTGLPAADVKWILHAHREKTRNATSVFRGGAFDQCVGNVDDVCSVIARKGRRLLQALKRRNHDLAGTLLSGGDSVTAEKWHPAHGVAKCFVIWALATCAVALTRDDRSIRTAFDTRRKSAAKPSEAMRLVQQMLAFPESVSLLEDAVEFCEKWCDSDLIQLARIVRPKLLSLDEPCSWMADLYTTLSTNSSHNPLNEVLVRWLDVRYPTYSFKGWPDKRSISLTAVGYGGRSRRQWCRLGASGKSVIGAEVKSVTANHWGDKSKELYDRVTEFRGTVVDNQLKGTTILVFDGDLSAENLSELATGIGHDQIWSVDELLAELRGART